MRRTKLRGLAPALVVLCAASGAVLSGGCSKDEPAPVAQENMQKGQAEAFRNRQGGGAGTQGSAPAAPAR